MVVTAILAMYSVFYDVGNKNIVFATVVLFIVLFDGLRWEMGSDWSSYYRYFLMFHDEASNKGFELGFRLYTSLSRAVTDSYSVYLFITTAIIYTGIFYGVYKVTGGSLISLFYLISTIPWYSGALRQMLALVFFVFMVKSIFERNIFRFALYLFIGVMFHFTMIAFIPVYLLYGMSVFYLIFTFMMLLVLSMYSIQSLAVLDYVVQNFLSTSKSFAMRAGGTEDLSNPILGFSRKIFTFLGFFILVFPVVSIFKRDVDLFNKLKFSMFMVAVSIILYYIGTYQVAHVSSRMDIYSSILMTGILIGLLDGVIKDKLYRFVLFVFVLALVGVFYMRLQFMDLFHPYSSIFYNYDYGRQLY